MNKNTLETQWSQIRGLLKEKFSNLSEEDIRQINGHYDELVEKLEQRYGYTREEAEDRIRAWNFDRFSNETRTDRVRNEIRREEKEHSSLLTWLLACGIPLLFLASYFAITHNPEITNTPASSQEQVALETPVDRAFSTQLRESLIAENPGLNLSNVQITSNSGVVTLSGIVANEQVRSSLIESTKNFTGVTRVIDRLQVR